jgi:hypothetical protein
MVRVRRRRVSERREGDHSRGVVSEWGSHFVSGWVESKSKERAEAERRGRVGERHDDSNTARTAHKLVRSLLHWERCNHHGKHFGVAAGYSRALCQRPRGPPTQSVCNIAERRSVRTAARVSAHAGVRCSSRQLPLCTKGARHAPSCEQPHHLASSRTMPDSMSWLQAGAGQACARSP